MRTIRGSIGVFVLLALLAGVQTGQGVAPPVPSGKLTQEQVERLGVLLKKSNSAETAKDYAEAIRLTEESVVLRRRWQGAGYWQTIDARLELEDLRRESKMPEKSLQELVQANERNGGGLKVYSQGKFGAAEKMCRDALLIWKKVLGEEHPVTARGYNNVAVCMNAQGKSAQALPQYEKALAIRKRILGEEHPSTARSYNNVAACLYALGKPAKALPLFEKALAIWKQVLGEEHPDTATGYDNLASCLNEEGKSAEALPLHEKALAIRKKVRGEEHPSTADSYSNVARCLYALGKPAQALALHEKALAVRKKVLGEEHPDTAASYNNLALCLKTQGKSAQALSLYEKALAIWKQVLGEEHPDTATGYDSLASCLNEEGKSAEALPLHEKALAIRKKVRGEEHPSTADSYNNVSRCLSSQGKYAQALPLYEKALAIRKKVLGENHPDAASSYNNLASCLADQGKPAQALPLFEKALAIRKKVLGEAHPETAKSYNDVGFCLKALDKAALALPLFEKALATWKKVLGEEHPLTATGYNNIAVCLHAQGKSAQALPHYEKALAIRKRILGEEHPSTANSYNNVGFCFNALGKPAKALPLLEKALAIYQKVLGEEHPSTADSYNNVAFCHYNLENDEEARRYFEAGLRSHDISRFFGASSGFDRVSFQSRKADPRSTLAVLHARQSHPAQAWRYLEESLARGLLDDLTGLADTEDVSLRSALAKLDQRHLPLFGVAKLTEDQKTLRDDLTKQRHSLIAQAHKLVAARSSGLLSPLADIQKQLPTDTAIVVWLATLNDRWGCVLRHKGGPVWLKLEGTGSNGAWTADDGLLPSRLHQALSDRNEPDARRERLLADVRKLWFLPLADTLKATKTLPAVRRLVVVPTGDMARLPVEALTSDYIVSYTPSATVFARAMKDRRALSGSSLLALGDPVFEPGKSSAVVASLVRSESYTPLPGTRFEVESLRRLVGPARTTQLLGSAASEASLADLAAEGKLADFRLIHLATHGFIDLGRPERSALILSRDKLPSQEETLARAAKGQMIFDGHLRVETIRKDWKLDADLVTLSACETALGSDGKGDGLLGFSHALLSRGARTVVLSRWKVDDTATALLMLRFYENLLAKGARADLKKPMPRAEALAEAKKWLRELPRKDVENLAAALVTGKLSDTGRGSIVVLKPADPKPPKLPEDDRPFAHPAYWAAFVLIGDPD